VFAVALLIFAQYGVGGQFDALTLDDDERLKNLPLARSPRPKNRNWPAIQTKEGNIDELISQVIKTESAKANYQRAIGVRRLLRFGATMDEIEFLGNWKGSTSSAAASENYSEQRLDTLTAAGGHIEKPYHIARDVPVSESLVRELMPLLVDQYRNLRAKVRSAVGRIFIPSLLSITSCTYQSLNDSSGYRTQAQ